MPMSARDYYQGYFMDTKTREVAGIELIPEVIRVGVFQ